MIVEAQPDTTLEAAFQSYARAMKEVEDAQRKKKDIEVGGALKREVVEIAKAPTG